MPSVAKSKKWFIRVTAPWEHLKSKVDEIRGWIDYSGMMIGYHHGDQSGAPHMHVALELKSELQKQSVDSRFKKLYGVERGQYSSKVWDGASEVLCYLYHDQNGEVVDYFGYTQEQLSDFKRLNDKIQVVVKENKSRASHKVVEYVIQRYEGNDRYEIATIILRAVAEGLFYDPGDFQLERYINEIELKNSKQISDQALARVIEARISRLQSFRR